MPSLVRIIFPVTAVYEACKQPIVNQLSLACHIPIPPLPPPVLRRSTGLVYPHSHSRNLSFSSSLPAPVLEPGWAIKAPTSLLAFSTSAAATGPDTPALPNTIPTRISSYKSPGLLLSPAAPLKTTRSNSPIPVTMPSATTHHHSSSSSPWQQRLFEVCREYNYDEPDFQLVSDRRGGRTAWSSIVVVCSRRIEARFWYDGKNLNNAREDAAELALNWLAQQLQMHQGW